MASTIEKVTETPASRRDFIRRLAIGFGGSVLLGGGTCSNVLGGSPPVAPGSLLVANDENGEEVSGLPLIWQADTGLLLDRFGALKEVDPRRCSQIRSAGSYEPANHAETRSHLMNELGRSYDVRAAGSMVIAQPRGGGGQWAQAIESLYRNFQREFTVRGIPLRNGRFPLISIVCPNQNEFMRQVVRAGHTPSGNMLGVYSALNNRMMLYDHGMSAGGVNSTIQHEAAHQYAFNLGLHIRLADNPNGLSKASEQCSKQPAWRRREAAIFRHEPTPIGKACSCVNSKMAMPSRQKCRGWLNATPRLIKTPTAVTGFRGL